MAISSVISKLIPLILITTLLIQPLLPYSFTALAFFLVSASLSFVILWLISAIIGMLCFWYLQLGNMGGTIKDGVILIASGRIIPPLWLFPNSVQNIFRFLPFQYIYQTPLGIYIGKISRQEIMVQLMIQIVWVLILGGLIAIMWQKARKRVLIQGGG